MGSAKTFRHGQILRLVTSERIANQEELRRRLSTQKLHVTQATLSRDLQELKLVKTPEGYRKLRRCRKNRLRLRHWRERLANFYWISGPPKIF